MAIETINIDGTRYRCNDGDDDAAAAEREALKQQAIDEARAECSESFDDRIRRICREEIQKALVSKVRR